MLADLHRPSGQVAALCIDLDAFSLVDDQLGFGAGDEPLKAVAWRFCTALRDSYAIARMGGDEIRDPSRWSHGSR